MPKMASNVTVRTSRMQDSGAKEHETLALGKRQQQYQQKIFEGTRPDFSQLMMNPAEKNRIRDSLWHCVPTWHRSESKI